MNVTSGAFITKVIDANTRGGGDGLRRGATLPDAAFQDILDGAEAAIPGQKPEMAAASASDVAVDMRSAARFAALFAGDATVAAPASLARAASPSVGAPTNDGTTTPPDTAITAALGLAANAASFHQTVPSIDTAAPSELAPPSNPSNVPTPSAAEPSVAKVSVSVSSMEVQEITATPTAPKTNPSLPTSGVPLQESASSSDCISPQRLPASGRTVTGVGDARIDEVSKAAVAKPSDPFATTPLDEPVSKAIPVAAEAPSPPLPGTPTSKTSKPDESIPSVPAKPVADAFVKIIAGPLSPKAGSGLPTTPPPRLNATPTATPPKASDAEEAAPPTTVADPADPHKSSDDEQSSVATAAAAPPQVDPSRTPGWIAPQAVEAAPVDSRTTKSADKDGSRPNILPRSPAPASAMPPSATSAAPIRVMPLATSGTPTDSPAVTPMPTAPAVPIAAVATDADATASIAQPSATKTGALRVEVAAPPPMARAASTAPARFVAAQTTVGRAQTPTQVSNVEMQTHLAPVQTKTAVPSPGTTAPAVASAAATVAPVLDDHAATSATRQPLSPPQTAAVDPRNTDLPVSAGMPQTPTHAPKVETRSDPSPVEVKTIEAQQVDPATPLTAMSVPTPADQVVKTVTDAIAGPTRTDAPAAAAQPKAARTMILQLSPANLGTVSIRMHLAGGALDLQLETSDPQTLNLLTRDRDTLSKALHGEAYDLGTLVIRATDALSAAAGSTARDQAGSPNGQNANGQGANGQGANGSAEQRQSGSTNGDRSPYRREAPQQDSTRDDTARQPRDSRAGSLYL